MKAYQILMTLPNSLNLKGGFRYPNLWLSYNGNETEKTIIVEYTGVGSSFLSAHVVRFERDTKLCWRSLLLLEIWNVHLSTFHLKQLYIGKIYFVKLGVSL